MKRLTVRLFMVVCLLALTAFIAVPAVADSEVSIGLDSASVPAGSDFVVSIDIADVTDFDAAQYDISYDPLVLEITSVTPGLIGSTAVPVNWAYIPAGEQGRIRIVNNIPDVTGVSGSGYLSEIHFRAVGTAGTHSDITISDGLLGDINAAAITTTWPPDPAATVNIIASVVADFTADRWEALVGQTISFTATPSGGSDYSYSWDFDEDGTPDSTIINPSYSFSTAGTKTVSLTVTDAVYGTDTETKTITVYDALVADATADIYKSVVGQSVQFYSTGTAGGKAPYTYSWDFGDGTPLSTEADPEHSFAVTGDYTVTLTVTDALGNSDTTDAFVVQVRQAGDSNGDYSINIHDITYLEHAIMEDAGWDRSSWCDMEPDGKWDIADIVAIRNIILSQP